jgi:hypothetical protein
MGTSRNASELAMKLQKAGEVIGKANRDAVQSAAQVYKERLLASAARDTGGDLRLSKWGRRGLRVGVGYDVKGSENATALIKGRPQGPWKVLEYGAAPHSIGPRNRRRRGRSVGFLAFPDGGVRRGSVQHPGSKGKNTWSHGVEAARQPAVEVYGMAHKRALVKQLS